MDSTDQLIVCKFDGEARVDEVYLALRSLDRRLDEIKLGNVAVVRKSAEGQVAIGETHDLKFNASLIGGLPLLGMLVGLIAGRAGILGLSRIGALALGGAAGLLAGVAISSLDLGFSDEALQQLGMRLGAEQWAIVMLVRPSEEGYVRAKLKSLGGTLIQSSLPPETIAQLTALGRARPSKRQLAEASNGGT